MAKGGHRRPVKRKKIVKREDKNETRNLQRAKNRERRARRSKVLLRQMRGMKWDEEEYSDEIEELDDAE